MGCLEVKVSLRFELFYALASIFDRTARVHPAWRARALRDLPLSVRSEARIFGPARELWIGLAAALPHTHALDEWSEIAAALDEAEPRALARETLKGVLHADTLVDRMLGAGSTRGRSRDLSSAIARAPRVEREWLRTLGLVPFRRRAPLAIAIGAIVQDPVEAVQGMRRLVHAFWESSFRRTFEAARSRYAAVAQGLSAYWRATSFADLCKSSLLRVRIEGDWLEAVEGGYRVHLEDIERIVVLPSAFNERRYWSAVSGQRGALVYLPSFEPSLALDQLEREPSEPRQVFAQLRALADPSRFRIVRALLRRPQTATELAAHCKLKKATVSHHVTVLARAQLVARAPRRGTILLSVDRDALRRVGDRVVGAL